MYNEKRKESLLELKILNNLKEDIHYNALKIKNVFIIDSTTLSSNRKLLNLLKDEKSANNDSLPFYFGGISRYDLFFQEK